MKKVLLTLSSVILLIGILLLLLYSKNNFEKEINNEIIIGLEKAELIFYN